MDRIDAMRVFTRIVERGSFVRAAEDLSLPASTVTDAVKQLEARLGARLLQRTTRTVRTTVDGDAYYRRCLAILDDIEDAEAAFSGARPSGLLRVEVQGSLARRVLLPALPDFLSAYPALTVTMTEGDRFVDPVREGIDCVLRSGQPRDSDLIARRVALMTEVTVASPGYVAQHGMPERWDALEGHRMVGYYSSATGGILAMEFMADGIPRYVSLPWTLSVNGADTYRAAALQGLGMIQVPRYAVAQDIEAGRLVECLPGTPPMPTPVFILYPRNRHLSPRVRVFIDWVGRLYAEQADG
jgi:DNA-binding transcriptional LysR family regulator